MIKNLLSNFHLYIYIILIVIITTLYIHGKALEKDNISYGIRLELQIEKIRMLEQRSKMHQEKVNMASQIASETLKNHILEIERTMEEDVPHGCEEAIRWGIEQARHI